MTTAEMLLLERANRELDCCSSCGHPHEYKTTPPFIVNGEVQHPNLDRYGRFKCPAPAAIAERPDMQVSPGVKSTGLKRPRPVAPNGATQSVQEALHQDAPRCTALFHNDPIKSFVSHALALCLQVACGALLILAGCEGDKKAATAPRVNNAETFRTKAEPVPASAPDTEPAAKGVSAAADSVTSAQSDVKEVISVAEKPDAPPMSAAVPKLSHADNQLTDALASLQTTRSELTDLKIKMAQRLANEKTLGDQPTLAHRFLNGLTEPKHHLRPVLRNNCQTRIDEGLWCPR